MDAIFKFDQKFEIDPGEWLVTGVAGFIGSNLLEALLKLDQKVVGLDNFSTGHQKNLKEVQSQVSPNQWKNFNLVEGDIRDLNVCKAACKNAKYILHQAALGSVPRSLIDPISTNETNVTGFLNMLVAASEPNATSTKRRFVYAASSSTYGDHPALPKVEERIGKPLSPYAVTKLINEIYAETFARNYGLSSIGLRYFNVFGPRQDPDGAYAAVIPKWVTSAIRGEPIYVNGDGETSRDFCFVSNVVQANILAATSKNPDAINQVFNVAVGKQTSLNQLHQQIHRILKPTAPLSTFPKPIYRDFRAGDVRHSLASISKAERLLNYEPKVNFEQGLALAMPWYLKL